MTELAKHHLSPPLTLRKMSMHNSAISPATQQTSSNLGCNTIEKCVLQHTGVWAATQGIHMVRKDLFKNNQRPTIFFFHSPLDIVYLINDQDTLGAEVKHTVKIKEVEMW